MLAYIRRIQAARREERAAQEALNFDYEDRLANDGPWGEDQTYLRLNAAASNAAATVLNTVRRRVVDTVSPYPWRVVTHEAQVGMILRHCTETERGAMLADRWDSWYGVGTAGIEVESG